MSPNRGLVPMPKILSQKEQFLGHLGFDHLGSV